MYKSHNVTYTCWRIRYHFSHYFYICSYKVLASNEKQVTIEKGNRVKQHIVKKRKTTWSSTMTLTIYIYSSLIVGQFVEGTTYVHKEEIGWKASQKWEHLWVLQACLPAAAAPSLRYSNSTHLNYIHCNPFKLMHNIMAGRTVFAGGMD